jgi:hypothetical protein
LKDTIEGCDSLERGIGVPGAVFTPSGDARA